MISPRP